MSICTAVAESMLDTVNDKQLCACMSYSMAYLCIYILVTCSCTDTDSIESRYSCNTVTHVHTLIYKLLMYCMIKKQLPCTRHQSNNENENRTGCVAM